jgi:thiamine kinase
MKAFDQHPFFSGRLIDSVTLLHGGLTHEIYKVVTGDKTVVVRTHPNRPTDLAEMSLQKAVSTLGFSPEVLTCDNKIAIIEFIDGKHISANQWPDNALKKFASQLATLHQFEPKPNLPRYLLDEQLIQYQQKFKLNAKDLQAIDKTLEQLDQLSQYPVTLGLCHNDLNPLNILCTVDKQWIIDWEFAAVGDVFFELAGFMVEHQLEKKKAELFLSAYFENQPFTTVKDKLNIMKTAYCLICRLWHQTRV